MVGPGDFAAVSRRGNNGMGHRFYDSALRHEQQKALFLHQQQMLQLQMEAARRSGFYPPPPPAVPPMLPIPVNIRNRNVREVSPPAALPRQPPVSSPVSTPRGPPPLTPPLPPPEPLGSQISNLDRFLESVVPLVAAKNVLPPVAEGSDRKMKSKVEDAQPPFFNLTDLWDSYQEWSAYGVEVPTFLGGSDEVDQYYAPYLSGIQLFGDPAQHRSSSGEEDGAEAPREAESSSNSRGSLLFEYFAYNSPFDRRTLFDKIGQLALKAPVLKNCRSCDLLPTSWIGIAWYPIYRIPIANSLKDLGTSFLTLHHLSTHPTCHHVVTEKKTRNGTSSKIALPVYGLASYKTKGSLESPSGPGEEEQEKALSQAFADWLEQLKVKLHDFDFFRSRWYTT